MTISQRILSAALMGALLSACGGTNYQKNPVGDLGEIRKLNEEQAQQEQAQQAGDAEAKFKQLQENQDRVQAQLDKVVKERDAAIEEANKAKSLAAQAPKIVYQTKVDEKEVKTESATITSDFFLITIVGDNHVLTLKEEQKSTFQVYARSQVPGVKVELEQSGLPTDKGARLTKDSQTPDLYNIEWTPPRHTVDSTSAVRLIDVTLRLKIVSAGNQNMAALQGLVLPEKVTLLVLRDVQPPSIVKVESFPSQVGEGTSTKFSVVVKIPGTDGTGVKPTLNASGDSAHPVAGAKYVELSGAPFIVVDPSKREPEYLGDSQWRFSRVLDTRLVPVPFEMGSDLQTIYKDSPVTHFNVIFSAEGPDGATSAGFTKQFVVNRGLPQQSQAEVAASLDAPRFDLSALKTTALELTPGETAKLLFSVSTLDKTGEVKVELPNLSTLPGAPAIACQVSKNGTYTQDCLLEWNVPCDATALSQTISLSAYAVKGGRNSVATKQDLKTVRSGKAAAASCTKQEKK